ncbi:MAG: hypothetical protein PHT34_03510 [Oscillospiraceae bacterium]|nr:hypothetical protein [Oscillospiraceae bacterium]
MEDLYLDTGSAYIPIPQIIIEKYALKKGTFSPFTRYPIVDGSGKFQTEGKENQKKPVLDPYENPGAGVVQMENGILFSTSEMIDLSKGEDSDSNG